MNILLTGASSFTGYWFAKALADAGHEVVAPLLSAKKHYAEGARAERVRRLEDCAEIVPHCPFGSMAFMEVAKGRNWDLLCHHAARVGDYRNPDFDIPGALESNTKNAAAVLNAMASRGLKAVVITGSVFEQNEGAGDEPLRAFSPYGVSKGLTADVFRYRCQDIGVPLGKFVISNPFGPLEEPRFCSYLIRTWKGGETASVNTPSYIRDNIHVSLLAQAYRRFVEESVGGPDFRRLSPSGYVELQGAFAARFASEMRKRLCWDCALSLGTQTEFSEPVMRVNTMPTTKYVPEWSEEQAWADCAAYYAES